MISRISERKDKVGGSQLANFDDTDSVNNGTTFTVDEAIECVGFGKFQLSLAVATSFFMIADAMEMMILSILSAALVCEWVITDMQQALISTCVFVGMGLSSVVWGNICDRYGRRTGLMLISLSTFTVSMASAFAPNYYVFIVLRTLTGVAIGGSPQCTTYYSEFLPKPHRALRLILFSTTWSLGVVFEALLALFVMGPLGWRWLLAFSAIPLLFSAVMCRWLPETPRFLITSGRPDDALKILKRIAHHNGRSIPEGKLVERCGAENQDEGMGKFIDLFSREMWLTTVLIWLIWFSASFCYFGMLLLTTVFYQSEDECFGGSPIINSTVSSATCKMLKHDDYMDILYSSFSEFPGMLTTAVVLQFVGRRRTMTLYLAMFGVFTLAILFCLGRTWTVALIFMARAFNGAVGTCFFIYTPEVYPTTMRAMGMGGAAAFSRVGSLLTPLVAEVLSRQFSLSFAIAVYGGVGLLSAIAPLLLPIETRGQKMKDRTCEMSALPNSFKAV